MRIPFYHVDAFTDRLFHGNPAGVCLLEAGLADHAMQAVAAENNLPETAFVLRVGEALSIRWFTPTVEVDLCGHATLAAAHVLFRHAGHPGSRVELSSGSGPLAVDRVDDLLVLDFPSRPPAACPVPDALVLGLGRRPREVLGSRDYFCVYEEEQEVASLAPDMGMLSGLDRFGVIVTAPGQRGGRLCLAFLRPRRRHPRGPCHGLGALHADPLLGEEAREDADVSPGGLGQGRGALLRGGGGARAHRGQGRHVPAGLDRAVRARRP